MGVRKSVKTFFLPLKMPLSKMSLSWCHRELLNWHEIFGGTAKFRDPRPIYASLNKDSEPVTEERLLGTGKIKEDVDFNGMTPIQKVLLWLILNPSLDLAFAMSSHPISEGMIIVPSGDARFNLRVRNASYARLYPEGEQGKFLYPIEMVRNENGDFTLPSVTIDNPLFGTCLGASIIIETDGDCLELARACLSFSAKKKLRDLKNSHAVSWVDNDHVVMAGHLWVPSFVVRVEDLVKTDPSTPDATGEANGPLSLRG